ncbi:MAG: hypothetical protein R3C28_12280 [Pirellulaceae bacterium]
MFDQVFENMQKATEASVKMQQDMFQKWMEGFPQASPAMSGLDAVAKWRHQWETATSDMLRKQKELVDRNYDAGIQALEELFRVSDAKTPQDLQQKVLDLYRKSFDSMRQLSEAQMTELKSAMEKWTDLLANKT